jgi:hypothetical protein
MATTPCESPPETMRSEYVVDRSNAKPALAPPRRDQATPAAACRAIAPRASPCAARLPVRRSRRRRADSPIADRGAAEPCNRISRHELSPRRFRNTANLRKPNPDRVRRSGPLLMAERQQSCGKPCSASELMQSPDAMAGDLGARKGPEPKAAKPSMQASWRLTYFLKCLLKKPLISAKTSFVSGALSSRR